VTKDSGGARLTVRDFGAGIAPEDQGRIFERFERGVSEENYGGFGLGLWISREVVQAHGGCITVESTPGQGATFTVELPLAPPPEKEAEWGPPSGRRPGAERQRDT
jgi:signal transduction histidine kinase